MGTELDSTKFLKTLASGLKRRIVPFLPQHGSFPAYLMALALMAFALWVRLAIAPVETGLQYLTFFPAVAITAIVGGVWPGLFATAIGVLLATTIFTPPYYSFSAEIFRASLWSNLVFAMDGFIVCSSIEAMHRYRSRHAMKLAEVQTEHGLSLRLQKETEVLLRRNQVLMKNSADGIHVMDMRGNVIEANDAFCRMLGYTQEEVANLNVADWDAQWSAEELQRQFNALLDASAKFETVHRRKDGSLIDVEISASGIKNEGQYFLVAASRDITARKQAEAVLDEHKAVIDTSIDGFWVCDMRGNLLEANEAYAKISGYPVEELVEMHISQLEALELEPEVVQAHIAKVIAQDGYDRFETRHRHKDGHEIDIEVSTTFMAESQRLYVFCRDITERKKTETALLNSEANLRAILDNSPYLTWLKDAQGRYITVNRVFADYLRLEGVRQATGKTDLDLQPKELAEKYRADDAEVMAAGQRKHVEEAAFDGDKIHWVETYKTPIIDALGNVLGTVGFASDITERKRVEQALREADQRKDEFLAMLAHELRNPLAPIRNAAHVIGRLELAEPKVQWAQKIIEEQVSHLARLVDDLLDVSRIARGKIALKKETIEFAALAEQVIESARPLAESKGHRFTIRLLQQAVQLQGDPVRLSQMLFNLLDNAIKYTPDGGLIEFAARLDGQELEISVRDNGMGIPAELLPYVFDLFQQGERTLDRAHGGLGIGLTLVQRLAEMHGGRVEVHSAGPGQGSTFTLRLPARSASVPLPAPETMNRSCPAAGMRVLVVEDDDAVADSTTVLLEMEGYEVRIAKNGPAALEQVAEFRPQVVLLDIGLKGMNGFETAERLRQLPQGRDLCLVAVTGYAESAIRERALASGCDYFLVKPVTFKALSGLLDKVALHV